MFSFARRHGPLSVSFLVVCIAFATGVTVLRSQSAPQGQATVNVNGYEAVAREILVQFANIPSAGRHQLLAQQSEADRNVAVGRRGLRRFRSRSFDVETMAAFFRAQPDVVFAEPNYVLHTAATPNDPQFPNLWGLLNTGQFGGTPGRDIRATSAWDVSTGSTANVVGVIDTGIEYDHPDLAANIWSAPTPFVVNIGGTLITCPAGSHGFDAIIKTCDPRDDHDHGTHVSGTIGAVGNNGIGVTGVNWTASIIGGRFMMRVPSGGASGSTADAINTIEFMIQTKAFFGSGANIRILSNSWGGGPFDPALQSAIQDAYASEMLFVAAAGNDGLDNDMFPHYPSSYSVPNVVAVAATTNQDVKAGFSNYGATSVHLAAPGQTILSTIRGGGYQYFNGTSMATPHVSGAGALLLSKCTLSTDALKNFLLASVDVLASLTGLVSTNGRLNVDRALSSCMNPPDVMETAVSNPPATVPQAGSFAVTDTVENQGVGPAGASVTRYYLSIDTSKSVGDVLLNGTRSVPALVTGASSSGTATVTVPVGTDMNAYFLLACADDQAHVPESDESNNCIASTTMVQVEPPALPDLVVTALTNPPTTASRGGAFSVTDTTANQGGGAAPVASRTRFYLSTDTTKGGGDKRLQGPHVVPALAANASDTNTRNVTIPSNTNLGTYFLIGCADDRKDVLEINESNNCRASATQVIVTP